ncbi:hypothetical protein EZV73_20415 [Acidaminobacter sp. JC074]|uniref:ferredoxin--NADP reductase n=1 Tax=Acidaminobacter sp. JC074 TaxID=2530199 RepID=UPI001F0D9E10|nr:hypothetical protein [Acidaminobacter sp. JC074]MCH4889955.1 hypothetical protein [Acidaminobacter sp. JC074]
MACSKRKNMETFYGQVINIIKHDETTFSFDIETEEISKWTPGEHTFLIVRVGEKEVGKKLSIASSPHEGFLRFTTRVTEPRSDYKEVLVNLVKGEYVKLGKPEGVLKLRRELRPLVLLSEGIGIAPMRAMVSSYVDNQNHISEMIQLSLDEIGDIYKEEFDLYKSDLKHFSSYYLSSKAGYFDMLHHELRMLMKRQDLEPIIYLTGTDDFVDENVIRLKALGFLDIIKDDPKAGCNGCGSH